MGNKELVFKVLELLRGSKLEQTQRNALFGIILAVKKNNPDDLSKIAQSSNIFEELSSAINRIENKLITNEVKEIATHIVFFNERSISKQIFSQIVTSLMLLPQREISEFYQEMIATNEMKDVSTVFSDTVFNDIASTIIAEHKPESFYDGTAGYGQIATAVAEKVPDIQLFLQEINREVGIVLSIKMYLEERNVEIAINDTITNPSHKFSDNELIKVSSAIVDSPWGLKLTDSHDKVVENDIYNRNVYGKTTKSLGTIFFVNNALAHLNNRGVMVAFLAPAILARSGPEKKIRQNYLNFDLIESIVLMPARQLNFTGTNYTIVVFNKNKQANQKGKILMINASNEKLVGERNVQKLSESSIGKIKEVLISHEEIDTFSKVIDIKSIEDANLDPERYVFKPVVNTEDFGNVNLDLDGFNQIPKMKLSELSTVFGGYNALPRDMAEDGEYAMLKITDIYDGKIDELNINRYNVPGRSKASASLLQKGDVVLSIRGGNRKVAVFESNTKDILISNNFLGIRCNDGVDPYFLKLYLESPIAQFYFETYSIGSVVSTLTRATVLDLQVPIISTEVQQQLSEKYKEEIAEINEQLAQLAERKKQLKLKVFEEMAISDFLDIK